MSSSRGARDNCHSLHRPILRYVEEHLGTAALARVVELAGDERPLDVLFDTSKWCSWDETRRLLEAAAAVLGSPEAVHAAAGYFDRRGLPGNAATTVDTLQSLGGPAGVLGAIAEAASKFSSVLHMEPGEIGHSEGVVIARSVPGFGRYPMLCEATSGLLRISSEIFGLPPAVVVEERCEARGDAECRFRVRWDARRRDAATAALEHEFVSARRRFDSLRATVAELVSGHDVDTVLERIVERASSAVRAPRYLLAVRLAGDRGTRVHAVGFDSGEAGELAAAVLDATDDPPVPWRLVVEVSSDRHHYGRLAAFNAAGVGFLPDEQAGLTAFAELAAAALDGASDRAEARRNADTASALLHLAFALAEVTSRPEVAARLASAVPPVVGASSAAVLLWDGERLATAASHGLPDELAARLDDYATSFGADTPMREAIARGDPYLVAAEHVDGRLRHILDESGTTAVAVVPIQTGGRLHGIISAGVRIGVDDLQHDHDLLERLKGLASLAATAFQNAALLDEMRHQALHDHLTGTPNLRLLEDRAAVALARGRRSGRLVALLFVDLDDFKKINDALGHAAGDDVLCQVADRLVRSVRAVDTVARLGGDEFAVLLPDVTDACAPETVRRNLRRVLEAPFYAGGREVRVSASIGIALAPGDSEEFGALLQAADADMYTAKAAVRETLRDPSADTVNVEAGPADGVTTDGWARSPRARGVGTATVADTLGHR